MLTTVICMMLPSTKHNFSVKSVLLNNVLTKSLDPLLPPLARLKMVTLKHVI